MKDQALISQWLDEQGDALNEDLSRILLRETPPPALDLETFLRRARPLAEELARVARQLEWNADLPPDLRRLREIADRLTVLLDLPSSPR